MKFGSQWLIVAPAKARESGGPGAAAQAALGARFRGHDGKAVGTNSQFIPLARVA